MRALHKREKDGKFNENRERRNDMAWKTLKDKSVDANSHEALKELDGIEALLVRAK